MIYTAERRSWIDLPGFEHRTSFAEQTIEKGPVFRLALILIP
jgi:hypothetical protein